MYIKSENLQAQQSKQMITDALLVLMNVYPFENITITQICQEAKVVRQTFYRNFESKVDILESYLDKMLQTYISDYFNTKIDMYRELKSCFDFLMLHKTFLSLLEKNDLFFLLNNTLANNISKFVDVPNLTKTIQEQNQKIYVLGFITSTISSVLLIWVKNGFEESSEMLANLARIFFSGLEPSVNQLLPA